MNTSVFENYDITAHNTFGVSATVAKFITLTEPIPLVESITDPFVVLGRGSNILFATEYWPGTVIFPQFFGKKNISQDQYSVLIKVQSSELWADVVRWSVAQGFGGAENLTDIPGTVGGAMAQNIGAYGVEIASLVESITIMDVYSGEIKTLSHDECDFAYRSSVIKNNHHQIVCSAVLRLTRDKHALKTHYKGINEYLSQHDLSASPQSISRAVSEIRASKLPDAKTTGNAGSFFKNPVITLSQLSELQKTLPDIPFFPQKNKSMVKIPAAFLLEKTGWKNAREGRVGTAKNQSVVLVNYGGATGEEIFSFSKKIQQNIAERFNITLEPEVLIIQ